MEKIAYVLALLLVVTVPPVLLFWFVIHPFAGRWRKLGPGWTYTVVTTLCLLSVAGLWAVREPLLRVHYGVRSPLAIVAALVYLFAAYLEIRRRQHLKTHILVGLPEVSAKRYPGKLLDQGIYSRIRHPRYVSFYLGLVAIALFSNYLTVYLLTVLFAPAMYALVLAEERELRERFGDAYVEYSARVPRFWPSFGGRGEPGRE